MCVHNTLRNAQLFMVVVSEFIAENTAKLQFLRSAYVLEGMLEFESQDLTCYTAVLHYSPRITSGRSFLKTP